jgi:hypothetical protein
VTEEVQMNKRTGKRREQREEKKRKENQNYESVTTSKRHNESHVEEKR